MNCSQRAPVLSGIAGWGAAFSAALVTTTNRARSRGYRSSRSPRNVAAMPGS